MSTETTPYCYRHPDRETHIRCQRCGRPICPDCMRQAAVGFQCPSCVREGNKATRQGTAVYGGRPSRNPALTSQIIIGLNVAVLLLILATGGGRSIWLYRLALLPAAEAGGYWWQVVTTFFTHVQLIHIGVNMLALWFLGPQLEAVVGRTRFLAIYLLSGLAGSALVMWLAAPMAPTLGASSAVFGMLGALLVVAIKVGADYRQILFWIGLNAVITFIGRGFISWEGHLGGFVGGVLVALVLVSVPRKHRVAWQVGLLAVLGGAIVAAILTRVAVLTGAAGV